MKPSSWLGLSLAASTAAHAVLAWQLSATPRVRRPPPDRDTFEVRMVAPPPEPPPPEPPPPEPLPAPEPELAPPPPAPAKPKPAPEAPEPKAPAEPPPAPAEAAPEPTSAPEALLADVGAHLGAGIVQLAGAPIGALSRSAPPAPPPPTVVATAPARGAPIARLADLSRKPKAPPLDAALRQNYPAELRRRGTEGQAEVRVVIDARGRVADVAIVSESATGFAEACRKTLAGSRWSEPLDREGQPVSTRLTYRCRFQIER